MYRRVFHSGFVFFVHDAESELEAQASIWASMVLRTIIRLEQWGNEAPTRDDIRVELPVFAYEHIDPAIEWLQAQDFIHTPFFALPDGFVATPKGKDWHRSSGRRLAERERMEVHEALHAIVWPWYRRRSEPGVEMPDLLRELSYELLAHLRAYGSITTGTLLTDDVATAIHDAAGASLSENECAPDIAAPLVLSICQEMGWVSVTYPSPEHTQLDLTDDGRAQAEEWDGYF